MKPNTSSRMKRVCVRAVLALSGTLPLFGFLGSCNDKLVGLTQYVDPCTTFLGNCLFPGQFQANAAPIGSAQAYCIDPTCTIPGFCGTVPIGTIRPVCK